MALDENALSVKPAQLWIVIAVPNRDDQSRSQRQRQGFPQGEGALLIIEAWRLLSSCVTAIGKGNGWNAHARRQKAGTRAGRPSGHSPPPHLGELGRQ